MSDVGVNWLIKFIVKAVKMKCQEWLDLPGTENELDGLDGEGLICAGWNAANTLQDAILLLEECHKELKVCERQPIIINCECLWCRVRRFISNKTAPV